jgi:aryl-alcohol dehydrogenase-like predicted oxidoreductase
MAMPHAAAMWDDYFERGGNAFDTAYVYGGGRQEKLLGWWLRHRGVREQAVVIGKGAHTPFCTPEWLTKQLQESLERLQSDYVDIYCLHRDNPEVPVGEFVEVLNEHVRAGRVRVFGGSNWSRERLSEANAYAAARGLQGFGVVSNNLSLAEMVAPVWGGAVSFGDRSSREWLAETGLPVLAWSSQARGYFLDDVAVNLADTNRVSAEEILRCWDSPANRERRARARQLAREKGCAAINIAAAYVLHQPFPTFALIGPRQINETISTLASLAVTLTPAEVAWLAMDRAER